MIHGLDTGFLVAAEVARVEFDTIAPTHALGSIAGPADSNLPLDVSNMSIPIDRFTS
jgi:hypothetical protein